MRTYGLFCDTDELHVMSPVDELIKRYTELETEIPARFPSVRVIFRNENGMRLELPDDGHEELAKLIGKAFGCKVYLNERKQGI